MAFFECCGLIEKELSEDGLFASDLIRRRAAVALVIKAIHGTENKEIQNYLFDGLCRQMWALPAACSEKGK